MLWVPATVGRFRTASRTFASIPGSFDSTTADHVCNLRINFVDSRLGACRFRRLGSKWVRVAQGEKMAISATHAAGRSNRLGPIGRGGVPVGRRAMSTDNFAGKIVSRAGSTV